MAQRVWRRQDDHRAARPPDSPLRHRGNRQRQLALQKPRRRSHTPRSPRLRNPGQLRRGERSRQNPPLKGVKIGRRYGVKFERRLTFDKVADTLARVASRFDSPWSKAASELAIFDPVKGPTRLAEAAFYARKAPSEIIQSYGLSNVPLDAKFIEAAFLIGIESIGKNPSRDPDEHLRRVKSWGLRTDGNVAFEQHRGALVDALVQPFADPMPSKQVRDNFISVLVSKFGDPRLHPGRWGQMAESASVIRRWLTDQSLRQFLDVFDDSALEHQWK